MKMVKTNYHPNLKGAVIMKIGVMIETKEAEKAWNGFRFAVASLKKGHEVKVFLMSEGVEVESITAEPYNAAAQMTLFTEAGGELLACGTCIKSRQLEDATVCPISTMIDMVEMVEWADQTITF